MVGPRLHSTPCVLLPLPQHGHVSRLPPLRPSAVPPFAASAASEVAQKRHRTVSFGKASPLKRSSQGGLAQALTSSLFWPIPPDLHSPASSSYLLPAVYPLADEISAVYPLTDAAPSVFPETCAALHHAAVLAHAAAQIGPPSRDGSKALQRISDPPALILPRIAVTRGRGAGSPKENELVETVRVLQSLAFAAPLPSLPPFSGLRCFADMHVAAPTSDALRLTTA